MPQPPPPWFNTVARSFANLAEFARVWARRARRPTAQDDTSNAHVYLTPETLAALKKQKERQERKQNEPFELFEENIPIVEIFFRVSNCWRYGGMGGILGFDWNQISAKLNLLQIKASPDEIMGLEHIETAALGVLNG